MTKDGDPQKNTGGKWGVFFLVAVAVFMSTLDGSIVNMALPAVMKDLQVPLTTIEWIPLIYLLTISSLLLPFGRLSDIKGRRWVYCKGFILFTVGSFLCGSASGAGWLIAARSFQGVGAAMLMACSPALVVDVFPARERGRALGMVGTVVAAGLTTGPALGGLIVELSSWRMIFYINVPIGIAAALFADRVLREGQSDAARAASFDRLGAGLLAVSICAFIIATNRLGPSPRQSAALLAVSGISGLWLYRLERRTPDPVFDPSLLKIRLFTMPVVSAVILFSSLFTLIFLMPFFLVHPAGFSMDKAGYTMVIPFVFLFFVSPASGWVWDRIGSRLLCTLGMVLIAAGMFFLSRLSALSGYPVILWRLALVGIGIALFIPPNSAAAMSAVAPQRRGIAGSTIAMARNLGMVIGVAMAGLIFNTTFYRLSGGMHFSAYHADLEPVFMTAFGHAMAAGGLVAAAGAWVAFLRGPDSQERN